MGYQGNSNGTIVWKGDIASSTGPSIGNLIFDPSAVVRFKVGTATFTATNIGQATLNYTINDDNGINITKTVPLTREAFKSENYTGNYIGAESLSTTGCTPSSFNGLQETVGNVTISQNGTAFNMTSYNTTGSCAYSGTYGQDGKLGRIDNGTFSCTDGTSGAWIGFEMTRNWNSFTARVLGKSNYCSFTGAIGGIAHAQ
jgi:hypothetical protein